jgi:hypothetical protein
MTDQLNRRSSDPRIDELVAQVAELKVVTTEVKEVLSAIHGFIAFCRVTATISKWIAALGAGLAALYHGFDWLVHLGKIKQ